MFWEAKQDVLAETSKNIFSLCDFVRSKSRIYYLLLLFFVLIRLLLKNKKIILCLSCSSSLFCVQVSSGSSSNFSSLEKIISSAFQRLYAHYSQCSNYFLWTKFCILFMYPYQEKSIFLSVSKYFQKLGLRVRLWCISGLILIFCTILCLLS